MKVYKCKVAGSYKSIRVQLNLHSKSHSATFSHLSSIVTHPFHPQSWLLLSPCLHHHHHPLIVHPPSTPMAASASPPFTPSPLPRYHSSPSLSPSSLSLRSSSFLSSSPLSLFSIPRSKPSSSSSSSSSFALSAVVTAAISESEKKRVLIVNTNSGGHAVIGFYFAQQLLAAGHRATVLTVGDESSDKMKKPPFTRFSELVSAGGETVWGDPAEVGKVVGGAEFDVVLDNNGKDLDTVKYVAFLPTARIQSVFPKICSLHFDLGRNGPIEFHIVNEVGQRRREEGCSQRKTN